MTEAEGESVARAWTGSSIFTHDDVGWRLRSLWLLTGSDPALGKVDVTRLDTIDDGVSMTASQVRELPLGSLLRDHLRDLRELLVIGRHADLYPETVTKLPDDDLAEALHVARSMLKTPTPGKVDRDRRRQWTTSDYRQVALVYVRAIRADAPARQAVADHYEVSLPYASKLIRAARDAGFIVGETTPGKQSGDIAPELEELL